MIDAIAVDAEKNSWAIDGFHMIAEKGNEEHSNSNST